jgi:hypothetical protein
LDESLTKIGFTVDPEDVLVLDSGEMRRTG